MIAKSKLLSLILILAISLWGCVAQLNSPPSILANEESVFAALRSAQSINVVVQYGGDGLNMAPLFEDCLKTCLKGMDVRLADASESLGTGRISLTVHAKALAGNYEPPRGLAYTGGSMTVNVDVEVPGGARWNHMIEQKIVPSTMIIIPKRPEYKESKPSDAPFDGLFWAAQKDILQLLKKIYGTDRLRLLLTRCQADQVGVNWILGQLFDMGWQAAGHAMSFPYSTFFLANTIEDVLKEQ